MDWLTFVSELAKAILGWPVAAVAIAWLFRRQLGKLIWSLRRVKTPYFEAVFGGKMRKAELQAVSAIPPQISPQEHVPPRITESVELFQIPERFGELLKESPDTAIAVSWMELEHAIRNAVARVNLSIPIKTSTFAIVEKFKFDKLITADQAALFHSLRQLRRLASQGAVADAVSATDAIRFARLAGQLKRVFDAIQPNQA